MSKNNESTIPRRDFLRGAAGLVGASVLGLGAPSALAHALGGAAQVQSMGINLAIAYWDGTSLVPAQLLPAGDASLERVRLTFHGFGGSGALNSIDTHTQVKTSAGLEQITFSGWIAPPQGCVKTSFSAPVDKSTGLAMSAHVGSGLNAAERPALMITGTGAGPKLREGYYVLVAGTVDWTAYQLALDHVGTPLVRRADPGNLEAPFQYVLLAVERS